MVEHMNSALDPGSAPARVVSLVPHMTDSITVFGLDSFLVGVSDECPVLASRMDMPRVGKPGDPRTADIFKLQPDLVLAGAEETPQSVIDGLSKAGLRVWVVSPRTVRQSVSDLRDLVLMYASESKLQTVVWLDRSVDWLERSRTEKSVRVFCPLARQGPADRPQGWVTIRGDTYPSDLISLCGGENIFSAKETGAFPAVTPEEVAAAAPEAILLPGEPYPFSHDDAAGMEAVLPGVPAVRNGRILLVDGRMLFWPGWRLGDAIQTLPDQLRLRE
jgi:ABC-type Fe3+-hydroxamate transport system substrate-binding protein